VLEIGGGGFPHPRSSIILDKFLEEGGLRQRGLADLVVDRPFIHADACRMPFPDKSFDYVIASHVIEHIPETELVQFAVEIMRVGKAGYIEAPGPLYETLRDIPEHIWFVVCADNTVHLSLKRPEDIPPQKRLINPMFYDPGFSPIISRHSDIWHTGMEWENSFSIKRHENLGELWGFYDEEQIMAAIRHRLENDNGSKKEKRRGRRVRDRLWRKIRRISSLPDNKKPDRLFISWRHLVVCPKCRNKLQEGVESLKCATCGSTYPILKGDIPSFVNVE